MVAIKGKILLQIGHFSPLANTRRHTAESVWGTRGPEFKSRRPD
jgi:hypothetical protein